MAPSKQRVGIWIGLGCCIAVQSLLLLILAIAPFGFDHPSSWGFDFEHLIASIVGYGIALMAGVAFSFSVKSSKALIAQGAILMAALLLGNLHF